MLLSESGAADATHTIVMPCANPAIGPITDSSAQPEITMAELHEALACWIKRKTHEALAERK